MATPNLNNELLKFRRRIGDTFTTGGVKFSSSNISSDGNVLTLEELMDIYNSAVREALRNMIAVIPQNNWVNYFPGYIYSVTISTSNITTKLYNADYILLEDLNSLKPILKIMQIMAISGTPYSTKEGHNIGIYIPPNHIHEIVSQMNEVYNKQTCYTIVNTMVDQIYKKSILIFPESAVGTTPTYSIIYIVDHTDLIQGGSVDINPDGMDITNAGLNLILDFAEREYIQRRQFEEPGINENKIKENLQRII